jgi:sugar phosphate isomerase/epimerase
VENHVNVLGGRLAHVQAALAGLESPVLGVNIDTANYIQNDEPLLPAIERLTPAIIYSHLKDIRRQGEAIVVAPVGQGELDWGAILAAYDAVGAPFPLCFEYPGGGDPEASVAAGLATLRRLGAHA